MQATNNIDLTRYKEVTGKDTPPAWAYEKVRRIADIEDPYFWNLLKSDIQVQELVPLKNVSGTEHDDYNKGNWLEMLNQGSKYNFNIIELQSYPDLLKAKAGLKKYVEENTLHFWKYGKEYILVDEGNHRVCFGKMLEVDYFVAEVKEYIFDRRMFLCYNSLLEIGFEVELGHNGASIEGYENTPYWTVSYKTLGQSWTIYLNGPDEICRFLCHILELKSNLVDLIKQIFSKPSQESIDTLDKRVMFKEIDAQRLPLINFKKNKLAVQGKIGIR